MSKIDQLNKILELFGIKATCNNFGEHKRSCFYDLELEPGCRIKTIERYLNEISMALKVPSSPRLKIMPEKGIVRLEYVISSCNKSNVFDLMASTTKPYGQLQCLMGETLFGDPLWLNLAETPHCLVAGTTGSGKSTVLHTIIANLLNNNVQIDLIDPKNIEFNKYKKGFQNIKVSCDYIKCLSIIEDLYIEMEYRYQVLRRGGNAVDYFPYHVLIIDEYADIIMQDHSRILHTYLCKIAQKSRACGIHIILATQRPSVSIVDGAIKANFPTRLAFRAASSIDSKIVLDVGGAEKLHGAGDAILKQNDYLRFQAAFTTSEEVCQHYS